MGRPIEGRGNGCVRHGVSVRRRRPGHRGLRRVPLHGRAAASVGEGRPLSHAVRHLLCERPRVHRVSPSAADSLRRVLRACRAGISSTASTWSSARRASRSRPASACRATSARRFAARRRHGASAPNAPPDSLIVGVSFIDTTPYLPEEFATGRARFGGVDARWMGAGRAASWRVAWRPSLRWHHDDRRLCRPDRPPAVMGPLTALARAERLAYAAPDRSRSTRIAIRWRPRARVEGPGRRRRRQPSGRPAHPDAGGPPSTSA